jgi:hypothetical protein
VQTEWWDVIWDAPLCFSSLSFFSFLFSSRCITLKICFKSPVQIFIVLHQRRKVVTVALPTVSFSGHKVAPGLTVESVVVFSTPLNRSIKSGDFQYSLFELGYF